MVTVRYTKTTSYGDSYRAKVKRGKAVARRNSRNRRKKEATTLREVQLIEKEEQLENIQVTKINPESSESLLQQRQQRIKDRATVYYAEEGLTRQSRALTQAEKDKLTQPSLGYSRAEDKNDYVTAVSYYKKAPKEKAVKIGEVKYQDIKQVEKPKPIIHPKAGTGYTQAEQRISDRAEGIIGREQAFYGSEGMKRIQSTARVMTFGRGKQYEDRSRFGQISENVLTGLMSFPIALGGVASSTIDKFELVGESLTVKSSRKHLGTFFGGKEQIKNTLDVYTKPETYITAGIFALPMASGIMLNKPMGFTKYGRAVKTSKVIKAELGKIESGKVTARGKYELSKLGKVRTTKYNPSTKIKSSHITQEYGALRGGFKSSKLIVKDTIGKHLAVRQSYLKSNPKIVLRQILDTKAGKVAEQIYYKNQLMKTTKSNLPKSSVKTELTIKDPQTHKTAEFNTGKKLGSTKLNYQEFSIKQGELRFSGQFMETQNQVSSIMKNLRQIKTQASLTSKGIKYSQMKKVTRYKMEYGQSKPLTDIITYGKLTKGKIGITQQTAQPRFKSITISQQSIKFYFSNKPITNTFIKPKPSIFSKFKIDTIKTTPKTSKGDLQLMQKYQTVTIQETAPSQIPSQVFGKLKSLSLFKQSSITKSSPRVKTVGVVKSFPALTESSTKAKIKATEDIKQTQSTYTPTDIKTTQQQRISPILKTTHLLRVYSSVTQEQKLNQEQRLSTSQKLSTEQKLDQKQELQQELTQELQQITIPTITTTPILNLPPPRPQLKTPPIVPIIPFGFGSLKKQSSPSGFNVFVRKKGEFTKITPKPLSFKEAKAYGRFRVGTTARATFKLEKAQRGKLGSFKGEGFKQDFYKSKEGYYIEKRERRIKSTGELREITYKGQRTKKDKKKRRFFL